jgi:leader peptidase (prepilin peptidase) / N-methyltransferase
MGPPHRHISRLKSFSKIEIQAILYDSDMSAEQYIMACITIFASPFIGSFGATVVLRGSEGRTFLFGRSYCDGCGKRLEACELIPVLSWIVQGGRCRVCRVHLSIFYPLMEAAFLGIALWAALLCEDGSVFPTILLGWTLALLAAFDFLFFILPNALTVLLMAGGLLLGSAEFMDRVIGLAAGGAFMLAVGLSYRYFLRREGLGLGDVKMFAAAGAWVGLEGLPTVLFLASALGLLYALFFLRRRFADIRSEKAPFGVFLSVALWLTCCYGPISLWTFGEG